MSWQTCPLEAITAVVGREPVFLGSKQQEAGHAALSVGLGVCRWRKQALLLRPPGKRLRRRSCWPWAKA